jgi:membrane-bound serine protease (ClpP class)
MRRRTETGEEGLTGEIGTARTDINKTSGKVFVFGEWWDAVSASGETIPAGTNVTIESIENFILKVKPTKTGG